MGNQKTEYSQVTTAERDVEDFNTTSASGASNEPLLPQSVKDDHVIDVSKRTQTTSQACVNLIKALLGPTTFSMPWAFQEAGLIAGTVGVAFVGFLSYLTIKMITDSKQQLLKNRIGDGKNLDYSEIAFYTLGPWSSPVIKVFTTASCIGSCGAYIAFICGIVSQIIPNTTMFQVVTYTFPLFVILSWLRSYATLSYLSLIGNVAFFLGVVAVFHDAFTYHQVDSIFEYPAFNPDTFLLFFGPTTFLFAIHYCAVPIESEMKYPKQFPKVLSTSCLSCSLLNITIGAIGYMFYANVNIIRDSAGQILEGCTSPVCDDILKNLHPGAIKTFVVIPITLNLLFTYLMLLAPPREYIEKILVSEENKWFGFITEGWQRNLLRTALVFITFYLALVVGQFGILAGFVGAVTDCVQAFVLPPIIYVRAHNYSMDAYKIIGCYLITLLGVLAMVFSTYQNTMELINQQSIHANDHEL